MLGIVFTSTEEAKSFVETYTDERIDTLEEGTPVPVGEVLITVTGPGKINATLAIERLLQTHEVDALLVTGTCVALTDELSLGSVVGATFVLEGDRVELDAPTYPRMPLECPFAVSSEGTLVTQDHTRDSEDEKSYWERIADVRDDTAYAVAFVAAQHGIPCYVAKVVSTRIGAERSDDDDTQRKEMLDAMSTFVVETLEAASDWAP